MSGPADGAATLDSLDGIVLGFVGTGTITASIVTGLCGAPEPSNRIWLSPRNADVSARLAATCSQATVAASNQQVLDHSDIVFLAVRPQIAHDVIRQLRFRAEHRVISLVATFSRDKIAALVAPATAISCAVPQPTVAARLGPTVIFPRDPVARTLFSRLGTAFEASSERELQALWASTAAMASYFFTLDTLSSWLVRNGVQAKTARDYIAAMFRGLSHVPIASDAAFSKLADEFTTRGGLNEQFARDLARNGVFDAWSGGLDAILARIGKSDNGADAPAGARDETGSDR
jgi:pyrroline-5-carboxylate reductase